MKLYVCTNHPAVWEGETTASIVLAPDETVARALLVTELSNVGIVVDDPNRLTFREVTMERSAAYVLRV